MVSINYCHDSYVPDVYQIKNNNKLNEQNYRSETTNPWGQIMEYEYLKSDTKRIEKKLEQLNKKYLDIEYQNELDKIEERCKEINTRSGDDLKAKIWGEIYKDVLELEKKSDSKKNYEKKNLLHEDKKKK